MYYLIKYIMTMNKIVVIEKMIQTFINFVGKLKNVISGRINKLFKLVQ